MAQVRYIHLAATASTLTYFTADGNHELRDCVTVIDHQCFHGAIKHFDPKNTVLLLVLQQVLNIHIMQIYNNRLTAFGPGQPG